MALKGRDREFRLQKLCYIDFKPLNMDRVLTMLFPRLRFGGYGTRRPPRRNELTIRDFADEYVRDPGAFVGFDAYPDLVERWIETDLMDVVNRGRPNQALAAPRPLHGNTYKFRNARHARDYGAAEQLYWMLYHARGGRGQAALDALKRFFFPGVDPHTDRYDASATVDVETQALLHFDRQVTQDMRDSQDPARFPPPCVGQVDLLADDTLRLLAYEPYIPRSVLVEYLKTLFAFHLGLYFPAADEAASRARAPAQRRSRLRARQLPGCTRQHARPRELPLPCPSAGRSRQRAGQPHGRARRPQRGRPLPSNPAVRAVALPVAQAGRVRRLSEPQGGQGRPARRGLVRHRRSSPLPGATARGRARQLLQDASGRSARRHGRNPRAATSIPRSAD